MAILQPVATNIGSSPSHSLQHRVMCCEESSPVQSVVVLNSGYVGINKVAPTAWLNVYGATSDIWSCFIQSDAATSHSLGLSIDAGTDENDGPLLIRSKAGAVIMNILGNGAIGIGANPVTGSRLNLWDGEFYLSDADVVHGITDIAPTNTYGRIGPISGTNGGLAIVAMSDTDYTAMQLVSVIGSDDPADGTPCMLLRGGKKNGTDWQALASAETVFQIQNYTTALFTILGNGNTGVNTITPAAKLHVANGYTEPTGSTTAEMIISDTTGYAVLNLISSNSHGGEIDFGDLTDANHGYIICYGSGGGADAYAMSFGTNAIQRMRILSTGQVVVNYGTATIDPQLIVEGDNTSYSPSLALRGMASAASTAGKIKFLTSDNTEKARIAYNDDVGGSFQFKLGGGAVGNTIMTMLATGEVGVGTTPSHRFHSYCDTTSVWTGYFQSNHSTGNSLGLLIDAGTNASDYAMYVRNKGGTAGLFYVQGDGKVGVGVSPLNKFSVFDDSTTVDTVLIQNDSSTTATLLRVYSNNGSASHTGALAEIINDFNAGGSSDVLYLQQDDDGKVLNILNARNEPSIYVSAYYQSLWSVSAGSTNIRLSQDENDDAAGYTSITSSQYDKSAEPEGFYVIGTYYGETTNKVYVGGILGSVNAATEINFYAAANNTTRTGTEIAKIDSTGLGIGVSPSYPLDVNGVVQGRSYAGFGGTIANAYFTLYSSRDFTAPGDDNTPCGLRVDGDITAYNGANNQMFGTYLVNTFTTAATGTVPVVAQLSVSPATVTSGGVTPALGVSLYVGGPATNCTANYSVYVASGNSYFGGKVGIGIAPTAHALEVVATSDPFRIGYNGSSYCDFDVSASGDLTIEPKGGDIYLAGQVGIGEADPAAALEIKSTYSTPFFMLTDSNVSTGLSTYFAGLSDDAFFGIKEKTNGNGGAELIGISEDDGTAGLRLFGIASAVTSTVGAVQIIAGYDSATTIQMIDNADIALELLNLASPRFRVYGDGTTKIYSDAGTDSVNISVDAADTASFDGVSNYLFDGSILAAAASYYYLGNATTDGSWRWYISSGDLMFEKRESGSWVEKLKIEA